MASLASPWDGAPSQYWVPIKNQPETSLDQGVGRGQARGQARIRAIISHYTLEKIILGETMPKFREGQADYVRPRPFSMVGF
jgi:hypothetical protein